MINKISSTIKLMLRVMKNLFIRPFRIVYNKIKFFFNPGKLVNAIPSVAKKLPKILKTKPEKREDYFDWGSIYIAKSLVFMVITLLILIPFLIIFLIAPAFISWWGVKKFYFEDSDISSYDGKVQVYFDEEYTQLKFEGRLSSGQPTEEGILYYENGRLHYSGDYLDGNYNGDGILYYDDGSVHYSGEFEKGNYNGIGELVNEDGKVYKGTFENGLLQGRGTITVNDILYYDGNFTDGELDGQGKIMYENGIVQYSGTFNAGTLNGSGTEYYDNGNIKYNGVFQSDLYNGEGTLYSKNKIKIYSGTFEMGKYNGTGTQYDESGDRLYTGEFEDNMYSGSGTLYSSDGSVIEGSFADNEITGAAVKTFPNGMKYNGCFVDNLMSGSGMLSDVVESFIYTGGFIDDDIDYSTVLGINAQDANTLFGNKLTQTLGTDCFFLDSANMEVSLKCSYAQGDVSAQVTEICNKIFSGAVIKSEKDITAPGANSISEASETVPTWIAKKYGIDSAKCYAVVYDNVTVLFWTDIASGKLLLKSATPIRRSGTVPSGSGDENNDDYELTDEEIIAIFIELGLDIEDFSGLGF